ncbi:MAG TPA: carboxypeptidase-like regulatory domain-containing protein [Candidatus Thermoplasmatota archaeon]|nr:carboxypeptidase-like regulatory domain-containing protein [Candidatus Thermoplasmatota archaeon]
MYAPIRLGLVLAVSALVAGCADAKAAAAPTASASTSAPPPTVDSTTGSITGVVVDDERVPLAGVAVAQSLTEGTATTDAEGRFTLNDLAPQTYTLFFEKLGYESFARKVDVAAGQVSQANATMKAVAISGETFIEPVLKTSLIHLDNVWFGYYLRTIVNDSNANSLRCGPCEFSLHMKKGPKGVLAETIWAQSYAAAVNQEITVYYFTAWNAASGTGTRVADDVYKANRESTLFSETELGRIAKSDKMRMHVYGGGVPAVGGQNGNVINYEHKVDVWTSFAYGEEFPDEYTSLPPP